MALQVSAATDPGRRRAQNEDSHALWIPGDPATRERRGVLLVIADGMGGALAGEVASRLATEAVVRSWREAEGVDPLAALRRAIEDANHLVYRESVLHPDFRGMGTTCTAVVVHGRDVLVAHVGDSRAYRVRGVAATALTRDHSLVAQLLADGHLTADQARSDPRRNVVTRSVGVGETVQVDAESVTQALEPGDAIVVSSDGLHGVVSDEDIGTTVDGFTPEEACRRLIGLANARGGPDNITVIVGRLTAGAEPEPRALAATEAPAEPAPPAPAATGPVRMRHGMSLGLRLALAALALLLVLMVLAALRVAR